MRSLLYLLTPARVEAINASVRGPHQVLVRMRVAEHKRSRWLTSFTNDPAAANAPDNAVWRAPRFQVVSGEVRESIEDEVGRELSATLVSDYWETFADVLADITPYQTLVSVERGLTTPTGDFYVPLGVFRVTNLDVSGAGGAREASINAHDLSVDVADYEFVTFPRTGNYNPGSAIMGNTVGDIIINLIREAFQLTGQTIPLIHHGITDELDHYFPDKYTLATDRDRLKLVKGLEESSSVVGMFNRLNSYEITPTPSLSDDVMWTVDAGPEGVLISYGKKYDREGVYNAVIVTGENQKTKWVYTHAEFDTDTGPTQWGGDGGFGYKPYFYRSPLLKTEANVEKTAERMLRDATSARAGLDFEFVPNPLLEAGDVVRVKLGDGTTEKHLITSLTIGLGADVSMQAQTKADPGLTDPEEPT